MSSSRPGFNTAWSPLLNEGRADGRLVRQAYEGVRASRIASVPTDLHPDLRAALAKKGVKNLYLHQAQALAEPPERPFVVTTATASGKSLCFQLPVIQALLSQPHARALLIYPTKALAQDQVRALHEFGLHKQIRPAVYDGDTPRESRKDIRKHANVILTNPDMLHVGILPRPDLWADFLSQLRVVVIDEAHVYRGVFGSHVANVLRRLRRVSSRSSGREPRFLLTSATIANPVQHAEALTGVDDVALIDEDGSPSAAREIAVWNPPLLDEPKPGALAELADASEIVFDRTRRSALSEAAEMLAQLVQEGSKVICFARSRRGVELVAKLTSEELEARGKPSLAKQVVAYRAGYTSGQRRELEERINSDEIACVVTTTALELGIDIGQLDACVVITFPGTIASLKQMWGRAGRRSSGLAVYIAGEDALDQYFCRHPDDFLERPVEAAILQYECEPIHLGHLLCAAAEAPLSEQDEPILGPRWRAHAEELVRQGWLRERAGVFRPTDSSQSQAAAISLRSASARRVSIIDATTGEEIGHVEQDKAPATVHDGAIYIHQGAQFQVQSLNLDHGLAIVEPFDGSWWTEPKRQIEVNFEQILDYREIDGMPVSYGRVEVTDTVLAYQRRRVGSGEVIDLKPLEMQPVSYTTEAVWYEPKDLVGALGPTGLGHDDSEPDPALEADLPFPSEHLLGSLHAAEHAQIAVLPLLAMCDRWDIGGLSTNLHPQTGGPTIIVYEGHAGGVGIVRLAFNEFEQWVGRASELISECPCESGCPSCVQSPKCGNLNEPLHKAGALELLRRVSPN